MPTSSATGPTLPATLEAGLRRSHIPGLHAMRAFSAFLVVFYHGGLEWVPGGLGVLAFFVLSGFLITWLLLKEHDKYGSVSLKLFYIRRALRIFPAFYCYWLIVVAGLTMFGKRMIWSQAAASAFYVNNYYQALLGDPNTALSHTWSLGVEEQFYLLWPALFLVLRHDPRKASRVLAGIIGGIWIYRLVLLYGFHVWQGYFYEAFDTRADSLLIGCLLAILLRGGQGAALWTWLTGHPAKPLLPLGGLVLSSMLAARVTHYREVAGFAVDSLLVAALLVQWVASAESPGWRWLNHPWMTYCGTISYSIYLYQQIVPGFVAKACRGSLAPLYWPLTVAGVILAASCSYWFVERPFLKWKEKAAR